jgi:GMP synthase-like glutamine amidotransferase
MRALPSTRFELTLEFFHPRSRWSLPKLTSNVEYLVTIPADSAEVKNAMRIHYLQHVPFVCLGSIETWVRDAGHSLTGTRFYLDEPLPDIDDFDVLIVLGGPMSANDDEGHPWLRSEKKFIRQAIDAGKRVLGICLGAQLIALVMGSRVYPNSEREIGWFPIRRTPEAATHPLGDLIPDHVDVFHWHGDTFDLPKGSVRLASSDACVNQAYAIGDCVLAFQFHLEPFLDGAKSLIVQCQDELVPSAHIQAPVEIVFHPERFDGINRMMDRVMARVVGGHGNQGL